MATMLETPSRIWRRIEAVEDRDMPSLPSMPLFEDSEDANHMSSHSEEEASDVDLHNISAPIQSTPAATSAHNTAVSTIRAPSNGSSAARFASSINSRSTKSSLGFSGSRGMSTRRSHHETFDVSMIPSLPDIHAESGTHRFSDEDDMSLDESKESLPEVYLPPDEPFGNDVVEDLSLTDALQSVSRTSSPPYPVETFETGPTPKKTYDYSVSLRSEPKASPFDKFRNVALRKTAARTRTPSLSRTLSSPASSSAHSTPHSTRSIALPHFNAASPIPAASFPLPRSTTASPAILVQRADDEVTNLDVGPDNSVHETDIRSMDLTDVQVSAEELNEMLQSREDEENLYQSEDPNTADEQDVHESSDQQEPTFSSDGGPTPYAQNNRSTHNSPMALSTAFSSPAPSMAFTPTPALPRPRARFNLPSPPSDLRGPSPAQELEEQEEAHDERPLTPHTRRRSFLLSVINSTARPRMKFPTPHPRNNQANPDFTPGPNEAAAVIGTNLQTAFAGVTPRPRARQGRMSHPLAQATIVSPVTSDSESVSAGGIESTSPAANAQWANPAQASPYDGVVDRASFISTASSHDLTTHHRVNTSFDPAMGFGIGASGHGVGRFNAGKLNNYLHGLNRRLQEENEALVEKLKKAEEKRVEPVDIVVATGRRLSGGGRRVSIGGTVLGNVTEDVGGEGWIEEKAELEEMARNFKEEAAKFLEEKEEFEKALEEERVERARDKERWKARMTEVEKGVEGIVGDLERRLKEAEEKVEATDAALLEKIRETEKKEYMMHQVEQERDEALERVEKAERALESGKELGGELREANDKLGNLTGELRSAHAQIKDLEEEVMRSDGKIDELEKDLREEKDLIETLEQELASESDQLTAEKTKIQRIEAETRKIEEDLQATKAYVSELEEEAGEAVARIENLDDELTAAYERIRKMEVESRQTEEDLQATKAYVTELEESAGSAVERIEGLDDELASAHERIQRMSAAEGQINEKMETLEGDAEKARELARQMEEALEAAEKKMWEDEEELAELKGKVAMLERELEREKQREVSQDVSLRPLAPGPTDADLEALEEELDEANKEIAKLTTMLHQSPARKAMDRAKDTKIEMLEREKEELLERNKALRMTVTEMGTPNKLINASGISPIHRQVLAMSMRAPRTPGGPLKDMSWLNSTTADPTVSPLVAEISRLQRELDRANDSIDDKLDKLEDAGLGVVGLTKKLEDARSKITHLEDEIARLSRREDRRLHRLERARCQKCLTKVDLRTLIHFTEGDESSFNLSHNSLPTEPPTPPTRTTEALRANLRTVNSELETMKKQWDNEKQQLLGERAVLQDTANRLNVQVRSAKEEVKKVAETERAIEKMRAGTQGELDKAKRTIADLEDALASERSVLRSLTTEQDRIQREKATIMAQLQRTESDMDDVKQHLHRFKQENHDLEKELRVNSTAEQKARLLEIKVAENTETIEQLRQERSLLVVDHKTLQRRFSEISEQANRLRDEYAASSASHDNRRQQLDLHLIEIDDLRRALSDQAGELQRAEQEKDRIAAERSDVSRTVAALEADLKRVKRDAEAFGRDLKLLRAEKERLEAKHKDDLFKTERSKKQTQTQLRLLTEQLDGQRDKTLKAREELKNHVCVMNENQLSMIKIQHNKECKGLIVQIRYLKAKFTRESSLRSDLGYQKQYLLVLLSRYEKSEQTIFASIARIGFPVLPLPPPKKTRKLKSIALMIVFLSRVKRASDLWREQSASKEAVAAALQDVRRRRAASAR